MFVLISIMSLTMAAQASNCSNAYFIHNNRVHIGASEVPGADANSFVEIRSLDSNGRCSGVKYGKDKNRVYMDRVALENSNPKDFGIYSERFAFSGPTVYFEGKVIPKADRDSLMVDKNGFWASDKNHFYCGSQPMDFASLAPVDGSSVKDKQFLCRAGSLPKVLNGL